MPAPDANAEPVDAIPMHHPAHRPQFQVSPAMIYFVGGVAVTLAIMYFCSQFNSRKIRGD